MDTGLPQSAGFGTRLMYHRQRLGLTQAELARRALGFLTSGRSLDRASISRYEAGANLPRREVLDALAKALGVKVDDLLPYHLTATGARHMRAEIDVQMMLEVKDNPATARLSLNRVHLPYDAVMEIMKIVKENKILDVPEETAVEKKES
jgi:transcriptional regulator with XRE-family HTH domain